MNRCVFSRSLALGGLLAFSSADMAFSACFQNGVCTNNGTLTGAGNHTINASGALDLTNNGTIIGPAGWSALATSSALTVTNFGTMTGGNSGIYVSGSNATINNKSGGRISGTDFFGVHGTTGASSLTLINDANATISGKTGILSQVSSSATITNRGTIESTAAWSGGQTYAGYGINFESGHATLNNYGTISGMTSAVMLGAGGNTFNIYDGSVFTNGIDYNNTTGNTTNFYTGSYRLGVKNYNLTGNTINLRGTATTLVTSGVVNGNGDIVIVDSSANATVNSSALTIGSYTSSVISDIMAQDIGIGDMFPRDAVNDAPQSSASAAFAPSQRSARARQAELAFADVMTSSTAATAMGTLLNGSGQRLDQYGNLVWSRSFGGAYFQDPFGSENGQRTYSGGTMLGYDWKNGAWRVGGFFGIGRMRTNVSLSPDHVTTDTVFGGVYGRYTFDGFNLDATFSGGSLDATTRRYVDNGTSVATGRVKGFFISPEVALGYTMPIGNDWTFAPTGRIRYSGAFSNGYTETGSSQNVSYDKSNAQALEERLELRLTHLVKDERGLASSYYVQATAIAAQRLGPAGFGANLAGANFAVADGYARSKAGGAIGAGFNYKIAPQVDLFGSVEAAAFGDKSYSVSGRGGLKFAF